MTIKEIAKKAHCSASWVYTLTKELGRVPTPEEIIARKGKRGRPIKYVTNKEKE